MGKKFFLISVFCLIATFNCNLKAQLALPYYTGFDTPAEQTGWQLFVLGVNATYGTWSVQNGGASAPNSLFHDYNEAGVVEDWYISPAFNFTSQSKISLKIRTFSMLGVPVAPDYIGIWYSSGSKNPSLGQYSEVINLTNIPPNNIWKDTTINLPFTAGTGYIGFKFKNSNNWFTANIDNVNITSSTSVIETNETNDILIYPNPSTGKVFINSYKYINTLEVYNFLGECVYKNSDIIPLTLKELDFTKLKKGIYFLKLKIEEITLTEKIVLQ